MAEHPNETLGERIKNLRENKLVTDARNLPHKMTQQELADQCGCCKDTISRIECGIHEPQFSLVIKIARALYVSIDYLAECV